MSSDGCVEMIDPWARFLPWGLTHEEIDLMIRVFEREKREQIGHDTRMTPDLALFWRDVIVANLFEDSGIMPPYSEKWDHRSQEERKDEAINVARCIAQAEIVVWDPDIYVAALRGWELHKQMPIVATDKPIWNQIWIFERPGIVTDRPDQEDVEDPNLRAQDKIMGVGLLLHGSGSFDVYEIVSRPNGDEWPCWNLHILGQFREGEIPNKAQAKYVAAIRFMQETIIEKRMERASRGERRRAEKENPPRILPEVAFIDLRRREYERRAEGDERSHREYKVQFLVRAHWRRNHREGGRPIFVTGYVKGSSDKPFRAAPIRVARVKN